MSGALGLAEQHTQARPGLGHGNGSAPQCLGDGVQVPLPDAPPSATPTATPKLGTPGLALGSCQQPTHTNSNFTLQGVQNMYIAGTTPCLSSAPGTVYSPGPVYLPFALPHPSGTIPPCQGTFN